MFPAKQGTGGLRVPLVSFTDRDPPATLIPVHMRIRSPQAMIKPSTVLTFGTDKSTETLTREQVFYEALGSRHINERQQLKEGGGIAFIRVGAVGIESGKYLRYFPDSGQEEKAISPPLTFAAFTEPDPTFASNFIQAPLRFKHPKGRAAI